MNRTTIMLPDNLKVKAIRRAQTLGISLGKLIRESMQAALRQSPQSVKVSLFADQALFDGLTPGDLAQNHDSYLYDGKN